MYGLENIAMLNADLQIKFFCFASQITIKALLVDFGGHVDLIDHDVVVGVFTAFENSLEIGYVDTIAGNDLRNSGNQPFAVRPPGGDDKGFASLHREEDPAGFEGFDKNMVVQGGQPFFQIICQFIDGQLGWQGHDKDTAEFRLEYGLADIFDVAVFFDQHLGYRGDDARSVRAQNRNHDLVHSITPAVTGTECQGSLPTVFLFIAILCFDKMGE